MQVARKTIVVATALLVLGTGAARAADPGAVEAKVRAGTAAWVKAYNAGDVDGIVALYAEDAVVMPPGAPVVQGRAALKDYLLKDTAGAKQAGVSLALAKDEVGVAGKVAWHCGSWSATDRSGTVVDTGSYVEVWRQADGKWVIARDIWNSDRPAAPAAAAAK